MFRKPSLEEGYKHLLEGKTLLWNAALNFIGDTYGEEAVDKYLQTYHGDQFRVRFPITKDDVEREGVLAMLKLLVPHYEMHGWKFRVEKAERDEGVINVLKCGSKSLLIEKNQNSKYYCRHCGVGVHREPNARGLGIISNVEKTGEDSCIKTFKLARVPRARGKF